MNSTAITGATTVPTPIELRGVFCSKNSKLYAIVMAQNAVEKDYYNVLTIQSQL